MCLGSTCCPRYVVIITEMAGIGIRVVIGMIVGAGNVRNLWMAVIVGIRTGMECRNHAVWEALLG